MNTRRSPSAEIQGYYCPLQAQDLIARKLASRQFVMVGGCIEKLCNKCGDYWPLDSEFWFYKKGSSDGVFYCCKACYMQIRYPEGRHANSTLALAA